MQGKNGGGGGASLLLAVIQGLLLSVLTTMLGSALFGILLSFTDWEGTPTALQSVTYISIALGGLWAGRVACKAGWLNGGLVGLMYMLAATALIGGVSVAALGVASVALRLFAGFAVGAIGGMLGVNSR